MPNLLSKTNAKKLAYRLKTYWASKGYLVETSVENLIEIYNSNIEINSKK